MKNILKIFSLGSVALLLGACPVPREPIVIHPIPKYEDRQKLEKYGPWVVEKCTLVAGNSDFAITTKGDIRRGQLSVKIQTVMPLVRPPTVRINTLDAPVRVEGKNRAFGLSLPFSAHQAAKMIDENSYLFVYYQPLNAMQPREAFFALNPLITGLGVILKRCK